MFAEEISDPVGFVRVLVDAIARRLVQQGVIDWNDQDDLKQELFLTLIIKVEKYDAKRGTPAAFCRMVLASAVRMILRASRAAKRSRHRVVQSESAANLDNLRQPTFDHDVGIDLRAAVALIPVELQELACRLSTKSKSDVARDLGIPRTTLNRHVDRLRKVLLEFAPTLHHSTSSQESPSSRSKSIARRKAHLSEMITSVGRVTP